MIKVLVFKKGNEICGINLDNYPEIGWGTEKGKHLLTMLYAATISKDFGTCDDDFLDNIELCFIRTYDSIEQVQHYLDQKSRTIGTYSYTWIE